MMVLAYLILNKDILALCEATSLKSWLTSSVMNEKTVGLQITLMEDLPLSRRL